MTEHPPVPSASDDEAMAASRARLEEAVARLQAVPEDERVEERPGPTPGPVPAGDPASAEQKALALSRALAKLPVSGGVVFAGGPAPAQPYVPGDVVHELGFVSGTRHPDAALPGEVLHVIASHTGRELGTLSAAPQDAEVVIDRGALFLVLDVGGGTVLSVELPAEPEPADLATSSEERRALLAGLRAAEGIRRSVPPERRRPLSSPGRFLVPLGLQPDGSPRRVVAGSGRAAR